MWERRLLAAPYYCFSYKFLNSFFHLDATGKEHHVRATERKCDISPLLERILVVVSYHWNVTKLIYLAAVLDKIRTYDTKSTL